MLRIRLLGELCLELEGRRLDDIASGRARSLLAWLAYHPGLQPRTRVAAVFWPDVLESSARASLRTTLATLRRELGEAPANTWSPSASASESSRASDLWIDVREIDRLIAAGRHADALALCRDELLVDLDDDWVLEARQAHRERVGELLVALGDSAEAAGDADAAVSHARRRLELDPVSEDAARVLMRRPRRERGPCGCRRGLRGVPWRAAARARDGALRRDPRAGRAAAHRAPRPGRGRPGAAAAARARAPRAAAHRRPK